MKLKHLLALALASTLIVCPACGNVQTNSNNGSSSQETRKAAYDLDAKFFDTSFSYGGLSFKGVKDWKTATPKGWKDGELYITFNHKKGVVTVQTVLHGQIVDTKSAWHEFFASDDDPEEYDSETINGIEVKYGVVRKEGINYWIAAGKDPQSDKGFSLVMSMTTDDWDFKAQNDFFNRFTNTLAYDPSQTTIDYKDWYKETQQTQNGSSSTTDNKKTSENTGFAQTTLSKLGTFDESTVTGAGDGVVDIPCAGKACAIELHHDGGSNFAVWTVDSSGNQVDLLVNTIGQYSGIVTDYEDSDTPTMLSITASGNWSVTFRPLMNIQQLTNGAQMQGDNVVYLDESSLTKLTISNSGSSNFSVKGIGLNKSDLLVNEIGDYTGTVIWNEPKSLLLVHSDGTWTISW